MDNITDSKKRKLDAFCDSPDRDRVKRALIHRAQESTLSKRTTFSTPKGTTVVLNDRSIVVLSPASGSVLNSPTKRERLYTWKKGDGKPLYHGITVQQPAAKRVLEQEFDTPDEMADSFGKTVRQEIVRLHIKATGMGRGQTLWEEMKRILNDRPEANRSIVPPARDTQLIARFLRGRVTEIAFLEVKLTELRADPGHFSTRAVRGLENLVRKLK